jgi:predicted DCC family thiol-disulfide oxidoreductase YuxK
VNNFKDKSIILFDGVCNLCNASIQFILKRDYNKKYLFASLQSDAAKEILLQYTDEKINLETIILIENGKIYNKSTAVLKIWKNLNYLHTVLYICLLIPKPIRDWFYTKIAKNRYKWFGKKQSCKIPNKEIRNRFLD